MQTTDAIIASLLNNRYTPDTIPAVTDAGVYALFVKNPAEFLPVKIDTGGLIYVGMTEDGLEARNHFAHKASGFSTLRRSLGAILKQRLSLKAIPRSPSPSPTNIRNYSFTTDGEERLSNWMREHLLYSCHAISEHILLLEKELIKKLMPPLCLTGWKNPQASVIKAMRKICSNEARGVREVA